MYLLVKKQMKIALVSLCALNFDANQFSSSICMFLSVNSDFSILGILGRIINLKGRDCTSCIMEASSPDKIWVRSVISVLDFWSSTIVRRMEEASFLICNSILWFFRCYRPFPVTNQLVNKENGGGGKEHSCPSGFCNFLFIVPGV